MKKIFGFGGTGSNTGTSEGASDADTASTRPLVQDTVLEERKLTFTAPSKAPRRQKRLAQDLTQLHAHKDYRQLGSAGPCPQDPSTTSQALVRQAVDDKGHVRTLRAAPSFVAFTTSSQPLTADQQDIPDALKTSVESVLRDVVYVGERRFRGTDGGGLEVREGPNDLQWKPCDGDATGPLPCARPALQADGRAYVVRNRRQVVDLDAATNPQRSLGPSVFNCTSPIVSFITGADSQGVALVDESAPGQPPAFALVAGPLATGGAKSRHAIVLGDGEMPAPTPERPYATLAVAGDRLLLAGGNGGLYSVPLAQVQAAGGQPLQAQRSEALAGHGKVLGFAHVRDGNGGTALHALCVGANSRLSSLCWSAALQRFEPGEDFGADALLYATQAGSRCIEVPAHDTVSLDGKGTEIGIIDTPHAQDPALRRHQLLFRDLGKDWKPFASKYAFHGLGVDPTNDGRTYALVQEGGRKRIAELAPEDDHPIALGASFHPGLADAPKVRIVELATTHEPERFAAAANGVFYYSNADHQLHVSRPQPAGGTGAAALNDQALPPLPTTGAVQGLAVDNRQRLHVLVTGRLYRHEPQNASPWTALDPRLPEGARAVGLAHNRLGDVQLQVLEQDQTGGQPVSTTYRLDERLADGALQTVNLRPPSPAPSTTDSEGSDTALQSAAKKIAALPSKLVSAVTTKVATMTAETFPAVKKMWDTYVHSGQGHGGLQGVYEQQRGALEELSRLAQHSSKQKQVTLSDWLGGLEGDLRDEATQLAWGLSDDLLHTLQQLEQQSPARTGQPAKKQRELLEDLAAVMTRLGTDDGEPGHEVMARLQKMHAAGIRLPYTGLDDKQARTADEHGGLVAARAAMLAGTMAALLSLRSVNPDEQLGELRKLASEQDTHLVKRATDLSFTGIRELENAYSARHQLVQALGDPTSPVFGHVADMLDASRDALTGPTTEPTLRSRIDQLKTTPDDATLRQELLEALRRGLTRHLLHNMPGDETSLNVERGIGFDAFGALLHGGTFTLEALATASFDYSAIFRTLDDTLSLELRRTKSYDASLGLDVGGAAAELAKVGGELRGEGQARGSRGAQIVFAREHIAAVVADFLDPGKSLIDLLSHGTRSEQTQSSSHAFGGTAQVYGKAGRLVDALVSDSTEVDSFLRPLKLEAELSGRIEKGKTKAESRLDSGATTVAQGTSTSVAGTAAMAGGGSALYFGLSSPMEGDGDSAGFTSLGGTHSVLPTGSLAHGTAHSTGIRMHDWSVPAPPQPGQVAALLGQAARVFPDRAAALQNMKTASASGTALLKLVGEIIQRMKAWPSASPAGKQALLDRLEALELRGKLASRGLPTFATARLELRGASLEVLDKQAPQLIGVLRAKAKASVELQACLKRALDIQDVRLHVEAALKPDIDKQAQALLLEAGAAKQDECRQKVMALCNDPANYAIRQLTVTGETGYASHANFAPVIVTVGAGSGAKARTVKGKIGFAHDADGISGFSASRSLREAHDTLRETDRRMRELHELSPVDRLGMRRTAVQGQARRDGSMASRPGSIGPGSTFMTQTFGSLGKASSVKLATQKQTVEEPTTYLKGMPTRVIGSFKLGTSSTQAPGAGGATGFDPYKDADSIYSWLHGNDGAQDSTTAAPPPVAPPPIAPPPPQQQPPAQVQQPVQQPGQGAHRPSVRGAVHKANKIVRKFVGATPPKSRKDPASG